MIAVADSSPLIILAKLDCFDLLQNLYSDLYISGEVYSEVVVAGAGLPGSIKVADSEWVKVKPISNRSNLAALRKNSVLGVGELSTIVLAEELGAQTVLLDDYKARTLAKAEGLHVRGTVGILEALYRPKTSQSPPGIPGSATALTIFPLQKIQRRAIFIHLFTKGRPKCRYLHKNRRNDSRGARPRVPSGVLPITSSDWLSS